MSFGVFFQNGSGTAVLGSDVHTGYEYHGKLTQADRISGTNNANSVTGADEYYGVANCSGRPLVFICDLGNLPDYGASIDYSDTRKMVCVESVYPSPNASYDWYIRVRRGYDTLSSSTYPLTLLVFKPVTQTAGSDPGLLIRNSDGDITYDSNRNMLTPKYPVSISGSVSLNTLLYVDISNSSISRPAVYAPQIVKTRSTAINGSLYFEKFNSFMYGFAESYSEFIIGHIRIGHNIDYTSADAWDAIGVNSYIYGTDYNVGGMYYTQALIIDADDYD